MGEALGLGGARSSLAHNPGCQRDTILRAKRSLPSPHREPRTGQSLLGPLSHDLCVREKIKNPHFEPRTQMPLKPWALHSSPSILDPAAWSCQRDFLPWVGHHFPGGWWLWVSPAVRGRLRGGLLGRKLGRGLAGPGLRAGRPSPPASASPFRTGPGEARGGGGEPR